MKSAILTIEMSPEFIEVVRDVTISMNAENIVFHNNPEPPCC